MPPRGLMEELLFLQNCPRLEFQFLQPLVRPSQAVPVFFAFGAALRVMGPHVQRKKLGKSLLPLLPTANSQLCQPLLSDLPAHQEGLPEARDCQAGETRRLYFAKCLGSNGPCEAGGGGGLRARNAHTWSWEGCLEFLLLCSRLGASLWRWVGVWQLCPREGTPPRPPSLRPPGKRWCA